MKELRMKIAFRRREREWLFDSKTDQLVADHWNKIAFGEFLDKAYLS
jgi:hypothetical protein